MNRAMLFLTRGREIVFVHKQPNSLPAKVDVYRMHRGDNCTISQHDLFCLVNKKMYQVYSLKVRCGAFDVAGVSRGCR
jgi:hypothetical protein